MTNVLDHALTPVVVTGYSDDGRGPRLDELEAVLPTADLRVDAVDETR